MPTRKEEINLAVADNRAWNTETMIYTRPLIDYYVLKDIGLLKTVPIDNDHEGDLILVINVFYCGRTFVLTCATLLMNGEHKKCTIACFTSHRFGEHSEILNPDWILHHKGQFEAENTPVGSYSPLQWKPKKIFHSPCFRVDVDAILRVFAQAGIVDLPIMRFNLTRRTIKNGIANASFFRSICFSSANSESLFEEDANHSHLKIISVSFPVRRECHIKFDEESSGMIRLITGFFGNFGI